MKTDFVCTKDNPCSYRQPVAERDLLSLSEASRLAETFKVLAGESRLILLHSLVKETELAVGQLAQRAEMSPQAVSNQLHRLLDKGIVGVRREGNQMHYRIVDHCVVELLERGICLNECSETQATAVKAV